MESREILEGIVIGILSALVLLYGLRPKEPYPKWMLMPYEQPWLFIPIIIVIIYTFVWSRIVGSLLLLIIVALFADMVVFGRPIKQTTPTIMAGLPFKSTIPSASIMKPFFETKLDASKFVPGNPTDDAVREGQNLQSIPLETANYSLFSKMDELELQPGDGILF